MDSKKIKQFIKENNYDPKKFNVKVSQRGYGDTYINVTIKDAKININKIIELLDQYRNVRYCPASLEILQGGNTFVNVQLDYKILQDFINANYKNESEIIFQKIKTAKDDLFETLDNGKRLSYSLRSRTLLINGKATGNIKFVEQVAEALYNADFQN